MKALFISSDRNIFNEESGVRARMRSYASVIGELHVVVATLTPRTIEDGALTIHGVWSMKLHRPFALAAAVRRMIKEYGIEVVSAQDPFEHGWAAMKAVKGTSVKLHIQVHTDFLSPWFVRSHNKRSPKVAVPFINHIRRRLADQVLPKADGIRTVSERVRASLQTQYGNRIPVPSVIPIAMPLEVPSAIPLPSHPFTFTLITAGRLEPEKRIEDILYALVHIGYQYTSVGLFVIGDGRSKKKLVALAKRLGLTDRVIFLGWQEGKVLGLMQSANAYIQASGYEGYGRTLIEAALAGIPIITTDVGIVGEVLVGYEDVLSAPPGDPAALATHIKGLVQDHQARKVFADHAKHTSETYLQSLPDLATAVRDDLARTLIKR